MPTPTLDATVGGPQATAYLTDAAFCALVSPHATLDAIATTAQPDARARALVVGAQRFDVEAYAGTRATATQALSWPRANVWDADAGAWIAPTVLPARFLTAYAAYVCLLVNSAAGLPYAQALDGPDPIADVAKSSVGGELDTTYVSPPLRLASDDLQRWPAVWRPLKPLLLTHAATPPKGVGSFGAAYPDLSLDEVVEATEACAEGGLGYSPYSAPLGVPTRFAVLRTLRP